MVGAPTTGTAGTAITGITLTAQDLYDNTATSYANGNHTITWSGPANSPAPASHAPALPTSTVSFTSGVSTTALSTTLYFAGSNTLTATDGSSNGSATITVAPAGVNHLAVGAPTTGTAGTAITGITLTAQDLYDNTATSYANGNHTITWSGPANSPAPASQAPTLPTSTVSFTSGVSTTALSATLYHAGSNTLTATDASSNTGSATITVSDAGINHFAVGAPTTGTAGTAITGITLTAQDLYDNTATSYANGNHTITWSGPANSPAPASHAPALPTSTVSFTSGVSTTALSTTLYYAGSNTLTATDASSNTGSATITVSDAGINHFAVGAPTTGTAGTAITGITLTAQDLYDNTATSYANGNHTITWSGPANSPAPASHAPALPTSTVSFTSGVSTTALSTTLYFAGSNTLTATDGSSNGSATITVAPASANKLLYTVEPPTTGAVGTVLNSFAVSVVDTYDNIETTGNTGATRHHHLVPCHIAERRSV